MANAKNTKQVTITQEDYALLTQAFFTLLENESKLKLKKNFIQSILKFNSKIQ